MTVEQLIYDRLLANATIAALVGTRVFQDYDKSPEDPNTAAQPFIVYGLERQDEEQDISTVRMWFKAQYSVACVAPNPDQKVALANAVITELKSLRGVTSDLSVKRSNLVDAADVVGDEIFAARVHVRQVFQEIWWVNQ